MGIQPAEKQLTRSGKNEFSARFQSSLSKIFMHSAGTSQREAGAQKEQPVIKTQQVQKVRTVSNASSLKRSSKAGWDLWNRSQYCNNLCKLGTDKINQNTVFQKSGIFFTQYRLYWTLHFFPFKTSCCTFCPQHTFPTNSKTLLLEPEISTWIILYKCLSLLKSVVYILETITKLQKFMATFFSTDWQSFEFPSLVANDIQPCYPISLILLHL